MFGLTTNLLSYQGGEYIFQKKNIKKTSQIEGSRKGKVIVEKNENCV